jgi:hypothetical protein
MPYPWCGTEDLRATSRNENLRILICTNVKTIVKQATDFKYIGLTDIGRTLNVGEMGGTT